MSAADDCPKRRREDSPLRHPLVISVLAGALATGGAWYVGSQRESVEQQYMGRQLGEVRADLKDLTLLVRRVETTLAGVERVQEAQAGQWREQSSRSADLTQRLHSIETFRDVLLKRNGIGNNGQ